MSEKLLALSGRVLPQEKIILGAQCKIYAGNTCIWTKELGCESFCMLFKNFICLLQKSFETHLLPFLCLCVCL